MTASPCRNLCQLDPEERVCLGCGRTIEEIAGWAAMTEVQRAAITRRLDPGPGSNARRRAGAPGAR